MEQITVYNLFYMRKFLYGDGSVFWTNIPECASINFFFLYQLTAKIILMGFCGYVVMMSKNPSIKIW